MPSVAINSPAPDFELLDYQEKPFVCPISKESVMFWSY